MLELRARMSSVPFPRLSALPGWARAFTIEVERAQVSNQTAPNRFPEGSRALVVEANRRWARIIQEHMVAWGMSCDVLQDGRPALEKMRGAEHYDVAVVGAELRDISIDAFVRQLRALPAAKSLPLILLTHLDASATLSEIEREVAAQVPRPLRLSELYNCILRVFSGTSGVDGRPRALPRLRKLGRGRLLIVDDNETNQFVAAEQAEQAGFEVDVASNGEEAVAKFKTRPYAAVLMDCQMPRMDGYTATRLIREWEGDRQHTPVIALTAHAMVGERDKVLAAGMDDYLSKPLKPHIFENMLDRHLGSGMAPAAPDAEPEFPNVELDPTLGRSPRMCSLFIEHTPPAMKQLDTSLAAGDRKRPPTGG